MAQSAGTTSTACPAADDAFDPTEYANRAARWRGSTVVLTKRALRRRPGVGRVAIASQVTGLYASRCAAATPDGCAAGALTAKASPAWTVNAAGGIDVLYVDRQLSLVGVNGRAVVVRDLSTGAAVACATAAPYTVSGTTVLETEEVPAALPAPFFQTAAGGIAILAIVVGCLLAVTAVALIVMRRYDFSWLPSRLRASPAAYRKQRSDSDTSTSDLVGRGAATTAATAAEAWSGDD